MEQQSYDFQKKSELIFTNGMYDFEFEFDEIGVRIKNVQTDELTIRLDERVVHFYRSLLILRAKGRAYKRFEYSFVESLLSERKKHWLSGENWAYRGWTRTINKSIYKHLPEIRLYNFIVLKNGRPVAGKGFWLNENIRVINAMKEKVLVCERCSKEYDLEKYKIGETCKSDRCEGLMMVPFGFGTENKESTG